MDDRLLSCLVDTFRTANPDTQIAFSGSITAQKAFDDNRGLRIDLLAGKLPLLAEGIETDRLRYPQHGKTVGPRAGVGEIQTVTPCEHSKKLSYCAPCWAPLCRRGSLFLRARSL